MRRHQHARDRARDEAAIRALEATYDAAWHDGDVEALVACLCEDAVVVNPHGAMARGRAEIQRMLAAFLSGPAKGSRHASEVERITFLTDDVAIVDGRAVLGDLATAGGPMASLTHHFMDVVVRRNDGWTIVRVQAYGVTAE